MQLVSSGLPGAYSVQDFQGDSCLARGGWVPSWGSEALLVKQAGFSPARFVERTEYNWCVGPEMMCVYLVQCLHMVASVLLCLLCFLQ